MPGEDYQSWSTTAANNDISDSLINWREGMPRASVNDSSRSQMAAHAKNRNLQNGSIVTTGAANAQAFASGVGYTAVPTGLRVLLKIGSGLTNTDTATLNMDGIGASPIKSAIGKDLASSELKEATYVEFIYDGTNWVLLGNLAQQTTTIIQNISNTDIIGGGSGSPTVDILNLDNTYDHYSIDIINLKPAIDGVHLGMQIGIGSPAVWQTTAGFYYWGQAEAGPLGGAFNGSVGVGISDRMLMSSSSAPVGNSVGTGLNFQIDFELPADATIYPSFMWRGHYFATGPNNYHIATAGGGSFHGPTAFSGVRIFPGAGNWVGGSVTLVGVRKLA